MKRWETSPREWNISYSAHIHTHTRTRTCMYTTSHDDVSRRSSRQILFRKIGLPLSSTTERRSCASADCPDLTNTHVTCVRARTRLKNFRGYHPPIFSSPTFNLSLFSSARQTAIPHEFSIYLNHAEWCRLYTVDTGKPLAPEIRVSLIKHDNIADRGLREGRATFCMLKHLPKA